MMDETIGRRTTLKVLGTVGAAGIAGLGTASAYPDNDAGWQPSEVGSEILGERAWEDGVVIEEITDIAGINQDGYIAGTGRTEDGTRAAFWWEPGDGYRSLENAAVHGMADEHIVGERDRDGETQAVLGHMDPALSAGFWGDGLVILPSLGGGYSAAHGVATGQNVETVAIGVSTTESGEEQIVQWEVQDEAPLEPPSESTLRIEGTDEASFATYEVVIDGTAELGEMANSSEEVTDNDDGTVTVSGTVGSGTDSFTFTGEIVSAEDVLGARYLVDGEEYVPGSDSGDDSDGDDGSDGDDSDGSDGSDGDGSDGSDGDDGTEHVLRVYGTDEADFANYEVYIDGTATTRGSANPGDVVIENDDGTVTAAGTVGSGVDDYSFTGEITGWNEAAGARLTVDGEDW